MTQRSTQNADKHLCLTWFWMHLLLINAETFCGNVYNVKIKVFSNYSDQGSERCQTSLIRGFSSPYLPALGLNTEKYFVSLRTQSKCGKIRTRKTPNTDTFYTVKVLNTTLVNLNYHDHWYFSNRKQIF